MPILDNFGVTDEIIAGREPSDYFSIAPKNQELVRGDDGVFLTSDRWNLRSVSADFRDPAIVTGSMIRVTFPAIGLGNNNRPTTREKVKQFAIQIPSPLDSNATKLLLRREGLADGDGEPPGPIAGATAVKFLSLTVQPQVKQAARLVALRYSITSIGQQLTEDDFSNATITYALWNLYKSQSRQYGDPTNDDFAAKARAYRAELDLIFANLDARYNVLPTTSGVTIGTIPGRARYCRRGGRSDV